MRLTLLDTVSDAPPLTLTVREADTELHADGDSDALGAGDKEGVALAGALTETVCVYQQSDALSGTVFETLMSPLPSATPTTLTFVESV